MTERAAVSAATRRWALIAILLSTLINTIDTSIVNVGLPSVAARLHASPSATVWVTTAFLLAVACGVPATSALGDLVGRRRLFLIGVPIFTLASLGCAFAPTLGSLVAMRALQGIGSATVLAVAIPLIRRLFPPEQLGRAMGTNAMIVALGTSAGPTLGGIILATLSWRWLFLINLPIGLVSFVLAFATLPRVAPERHSFDWQGSAWAAAAIGSLLMGVRQLASAATLWHAAVLLVGCAVCAVLFVRRERVAARPVIPLGLFTRSFALTVGTAGASFFGQGIAFVGLPFLLQSSFGASPLESALLFTPWPLTIVFVAPVSGRLADRFRPANLTFAGLTIYAAGLALLALSGPMPAVWLVLVATTVCGLGFGTFQSPNNRDMMAAAPLRYTASASAVLNTNRSIGQSTGSAAVSIALVSAGAATGAIAKQAHAASDVLWVAVAAAAIAALLTATKLLATRAGEPRLDTVRG